MSFDNGKELHIVVFPWLAFGHLIPFLELSKHLARKGHRISFISTPRNIQRLPKIPPNLSPSLNFVELSLNYVENLPENAEATIDVPNDKVQYLKKAFDGLQGQLTSFLQVTPPDWIIYDFAPYWLPPIAGKLGIRSAYFCIYTASMVCFVGPPPIHLNGEDPRTTPEHFTVPPPWIPFPSNLVYRLYEIKKLFNVLEENVSGVSDIFRAASILQGCDIVVIRSCKEMEQEFLCLLQEDILKKPVIPIGLLPPSPATGGEKDEKWLTICNWLDRQEKASVIYVAFGSETVPSEEETTQLALGLELSQLPFFWVLRRPACSTENPSSDILPAGFEERTRHRGFICRDWAPQLLILGHSSVGGFLTHGGWSSVIESLGLGCPLILFPLVNDQVARLLEWKKIAMEIPRNEQDGSFGKEAVAETVRFVMVDKEGETYRCKAKAMKELFGDEVRHDQYVEDFTRYLSMQATNPPQKTS